MRIQKLDLFGFKSFPDRTTFEFGSGISCVVGPNGSGKSNVVDALRWCIGEQSARSLRGAEMSDVIFAGSAARSPVGFAEVVLTLSSAGGEPFPGDFARFEEVEVGRRLYRNGTSEYLINRVKCRRRDILELFLDTGVGSNLYSFIAQGQVDRIVSQSANDRRSLIDEAAGITRYKARREEAMARLTATAAQLDRAADVSDEMGKRIRSLERQVLKAGRFRRARAQIRQREIVLGVVKYGAYAEDRRALREKLRHTRDDGGALKRSVERLGTELEARTAEVDSVRDALQQWRDEAAELEAQRREAEGARRLQGDRHRELMAAAERARLRGEAAQRAIQAAESELAQLQEEAGRLRAGDGSEAVVLARTARELAAEVLAEYRGAVEGLRAAEARRTERVRTLREELERTRTRIAGLEAEPVAEASSWIDEGGAEAEHLAALEEAREAALSARSRREKARDVLAEAEKREADRVRQAEAALSSWRRERAEREAKLSELRRWFRDERRAAATSRARSRSDQLGRARSRASAWIAALQHHHRVRATDLEAQHAAALEGVRSKQTRDTAALRSEEAAAVAAIDSELDTASVERARAAVDSARAAATAAEAERRTRGEEAARASGALRAIEAEFAELDARRSAVVPPAWAQRRLLIDVAPPDDPRRQARPDLLGLPVVQPADLNLDGGQGVLDGVRSPWRIVETVEEAMRYLAEQGPPVATRDGRLRVDADGFVELGDRPEDRWAEVRDGLAEARSRASEADAAAGVSAATAQSARVRADRYQDELEAVESALSLARENRLAEIRESFAERAADLVRQFALAERACIEARDRAIGELSADHRQQLAQAEADRDSVLAALPMPSSAEPYLRTALAMGWPTPVGEPPVSGPMVDLEAPRQQVRSADSAVERADSAVVQAASALDAFRERARERDRIAAEREAARAARQAEAERARARLLEVEAELEISSTDPALDAAESALESAEAALSRADVEWREVEAAAATSRERLLSIEAGIARSERSIKEGQLAQEEAQKETVDNRSAANEALDKAERAEAEAAALAVQRSETLTRVERDRERLQKLTAEQDRVRGALEDSRERAVRADSEQGELEQRVENLQLEIEALRKRLGDRYQVSLPGLLDRLWMRKRLVIEPDEAVTTALVVRETELEPVEPLSIGVAFADDAEKITEMVGEVEELRSILQRIGEVNLAAEQEYRELDVRYRELQEQTADLEASVKTIRSAIAKMNRTCRERFRDAYDRVNEAFKLSYPRLVGGGDARLALTNEEDLLETGVDIFVRPPGKRLQNLTLLSGGEKAMTAIALLLALFKVKPSPFCVLDEVDAPLDEANGARFNDMVREMSRMSQFIVITHNRKTMECADVLYGVTMARPGVSTLVSVALGDGRDA